MKLIGCKVAWINEIPSARSPSDTDPLVAFVSTEASRRCDVILKAEGGTRVVGWWVVVYVVGRYLGLWAYAQLGSTR